MILEISIIHFITFSLEFGPTYQIISKHVIALVSITALHMNNKDHKLVIPPNLILSINSTNFEVNKIIVLYSKLNSLSYFARNILGYIL